MEAQTFHDQSALLALCSLWLGVPADRAHAPELQNLQVHGSYWAPVIKKFSESLRFCSGRSWIVVFSWT